MNSFSDSQTDRNHPHDQSCTHITRTGNPNAYNILSTNVLIPFGKPQLVSYMNLNNILLSVFKHKLDAVSIKICPRAREES
jgi:hypothetical protein